MASPQQTPAGSHSDDEALSRISTPAPRLRGDDMPSTPSQLPGGCPPTTPLLLTDTPSPPKRRRLRGKTRSTSSASRLRRRSGIWLHASGQATTTKLLIPESRHGRRLIVSASPTSTCRYPALVMQTGSPCSNRFFIQFLRPNWHILLSVRSGGE